MSEVKFYDLTTPSNPNDVWNVHICYKDNIVLDEAIEVSSLFMLRIKVALLLTKALPHLFNEGYSCIVLDEVYEEDVEIVNSNIYIACDRLAPYNTVITHTTLFFSCVSTKL